MKGKYLITTDNWFVAPDGQEYKAVWGNVEILSDSILGVKTNRQSVNWYAKIGIEDNHIIIAGCQMNYAVRSEKRPSNEKCIAWSGNHEAYNEFAVPTKIYFTE